MPNDRNIPNKGSSDKVTTKIRIGGQDVPEKYKPLSMATLKELNRIPFARIALLDGEASKEEFTASNEELFTPGKEIEILAGYDSKEDPIFKGVIVRHSVHVRQDGKSMLKLDCRDKAFAATISPVNKYFAGLADADVAGQILGEYDLELSINDLEIEHDELVQYQASDWEFVVARCKANGAYTLADGGKVTIQKPDFTQDPVLTLQFGATIVEFDGEIDARTQFTTIKASSWDYASQEMIEAEGSEPDGLPEFGNLSSADLAGVAGKSFEVYHSGQVVQDELQAWADSLVLRSRLSRNRGRVKFTGFAELIPGNLIEIKGMGDRFNGPAFVTAVRHDIVNGEWHTQAQFGLEEDWFLNADTRKDSPGSLLPGINGLHIGVVSQLQEDPEGENRILVKLPSISAGDEGTWARVATLDAGESRGSFFLPEVGDEVVVGFLQDDPRDAVVLGMLNSSAKPAPLEASDDNFEKGFVTKSEMKILFNDETKTLTLSTPAGKSVVLDEDAGVIKLEDENGNKIVMDSSGIVIESAADLKLKAGSNMQVEGGANTEIKAGANFKAEGSAGAEVTTSAIAVLKGSLVQIN